MSRDLYEPEEPGDDQAELAFAPGTPAPSSRTGEPRRAEFFRPQRRPILPLVGLIGAVATVAAFLWLGRDEPAPQPETPGADATGPLAAAPDFEVPIPEAPIPPPGPSPLAGVPGELEPAPAQPVPATADLAAAADAEALPPVAAAAPERAAAPAAPVPKPAAAIPVPAPKAAARPAPSATASSRGGYSVQLLAARSEAQVGGAWKKLRGAHPDLLASLAPTITPTAHGANETLYRLRAGPLRDRAAADALCRQLAARHQSCFVVAPGS